MVAFFLELLFKNVYQSEITTSFGLLCYFSCTKVKYTYNVCMLSINIQKKFINGLF